MRNILLRNHYVVAMRPLQLITFDMTGTLLAFTSPVVQQYAQIAARYDIHSKSETLEANFKKSWKTLSAQHPNFGRDTGLGWRNWWRSIVCETFRDSYQPSHKTNINALADDLIGHFETDRAWRVADSGTKLLKTLKDRGFTLGVISNFDPRLNTILKNLRLTEYFTFVLTSYDTGFEKPDRRIFQKAAEMGKLKDLVHIGNDRRLDYNGARSAGFNAILLDCGQKEMDLKFPSRAGSLQEIPDCLKYYTNDQTN